MSGLPTGVFPDVLAPVDLYDRSRRRAKVRKTRSAVAVASIATLLGAAGGYGLTQSAPSNDSLVVGGGGPTVRSSQPVAAPADAQLIAMVGRCDGRCTVVGRVQTRGGDTFAVIGTLMGGIDPALPGTVSFVLAHGTQLLAKVAPDTSSPVYADHRVPLRADDTGNVIVPTVFGNTLGYLPFRLLDGTITLLQGTYQEPLIRGDNNSAIVDANADGQREIVTVGHRATSSGARAYTYQSWRWDGSKYRAEACSPTPAGATGPSCGLASYPS